MLDRYSVLDGRIAHSDEGTIPVDIYVMPDGDERARLTDEYGIDPHTLASSTDPDETPRIEFEDDYTAIILKYPKNYSADDNFLFLVKSMGIFLFADRVVLVIDGSGFYRGTALKEYRSNMNVTWRLPTEELEAQFIKEAAAAGMKSLKGHRSVGGIRASIYNAFPMAGVDCLVDFMKEFEKKNG